MKISDRIEIWLKGDKDAISFIRDVMGVVELWDDLIDRDSIITDDTINSAFYAAMVSIPRNAFYQRNFALLSPLIENAIFDWWAANELEDGNEDDLHSAYILRCSGLALITMSARIVGGVEWANAVSKELRREGDKWNEYAAKHAAPSKKLRSV